MKFHFSLFVVVLLIASCSSTTRDYKGVYESTADIEDLVVPPDLDKPLGAGDSALPELQRSIKTYSSYEEKLGSPSKTRYAQDYEGMRFVREGSLFWLELKAPGEEIWNDIRTFFIRLGFKIIKEQPRIGYMETNWLENKVNIPTNIISQMLSKLYSVELLDKFRVRLEWDTEKEVSRLFITHQGLKEAAEETIDNVTIVTTEWVAREPDPDLEVEMMMRFMAFRGLEEKVAEQHIASVKPTQLAKLEGEENKTALIINEPFARAWRHVSIAMDRLGFLIEDKNRAGGVYYIELPETFEIPKQGGLFGGLFADTEKPSQLKYLIALEEKGDVTEVTVRANGEVPKEMPIIMDKILKDIQRSIL